jgi:ubiquinone/menaquinone biosynthesis C-methylase UbiE
MGLSFHVCPWWLARTLDNPIRRVIHNPNKILGSYIDQGQTVLDLGCGSGTFTMAMARMVGEAGRVIAIDVHDEMLQIVRQKAIKEGLEPRIITHKSKPNGIGISDKVDFALAFYMIHEVPDTEAFLKEIASLLKPTGKLLIVEPLIHVSSSSFSKTLDAALQAGLKQVSEPQIRFSRSALFQPSYLYIPTNEEIYGSNNLM